MIEAADRVEFLNNGYVERDMVGSPWSTMDVRLYHGEGFLSFNTILRFNSLDDLARVARLKAGFAYLYKKERHEPLRVVVQAREVDGIIIWEANSVAVPDKLLTIRFASEDLATFLFEHKRFPVLVQYR